MNITFASRRLQRQMRSEREMAKAFGARAAILKRRLALLMAVECLADVPSGPPERRHLLKGARAGCFSVDLGRNWRLVFRPANEPLPLLPDGGLNLEKVTAIEIVEVVDYH